MAGLIDSVDGLAFGSGLQFETRIGTAGLIIPANSSPSDILTSDGSIMLSSDGDLIVTVR